jgi:hypothetical protein
MSSEMQQVCNDESERRGQLNATGLGRSRIARKELNTEQDFAKPP